MKVIVHTMIAHRIITQRENVKVTKNGISATSCDILGWMNKEHVAGQGQKWSAWARRGAGSEE